MKVCIKTESLFIFFTLLTSLTLFSSSEQSPANKLKIRTFSAAEQKRLTTWHKQRIPCPENSPEGSPKSIPLPDFNAEIESVLKEVNQQPLRRTKSLNDLPTQKIIASAMYIASQAHSDQVAPPLLTRDLKLASWKTKKGLVIQDEQAETVQQKIESASEALKKGENILKARSQNLFMKKCIVTTIGALLAGTTFYSTAPEGTRSGKVFGIDDINGVAYVKTIIEPFCYAALGGFIFNGVYNLIYGTMQQQISILQKEVNQLKPTLTAMEAIVSQNKEKTDQMEQDLSKMIDKMTTVESNVARVKDDSKQTLDITQALYKQINSSDLDKIVEDVEKVTQDINDLSTESQATFKKEDKKKGFFRFGYPFKLSNK